VLAYIRKRTHASNREAGPPPSKKAKLIHTTTNRTKRHNAKTVDDAKVFYRSVFHNSQEAEADAKQQDAFSQERAQ
jgi:hypothetical protein